MTRVLHVTRSSSRHGGGVSAWVWTLARHAQDFGVISEIATVEDERTREDADSRGVEVHAFPLTGSQALGTSRPLAEWLMREAGKYDLIHVHGLWQHPGYAARRAAVRHHRPLMISPQGMLEPWALQRSRWKKRLVGMLFERVNLRRADCLQATAVPEAEHFRDFGLSNPVAIVPLGLEMQDYWTTDREGSVEAQWPELRGHKRLLFLSRVHPKKGLLMLADAWGELHRQFPDWRLVITGPDELGHTQEVRQRIAAVGAADATLFTGPVHGAMKTNLYAAADMFVLPTHSENYGLVVPESLACGTPVITTDATPWTPLPEVGCGWCIPVATRSLVESLQEAMSLDDAQRAEMGCRGRAWVQAHFASEIVAHQVADTYRWMLGQGDRPRYVVEAGESVPAQGEGATVI